MPTEPIRELLPREIESHGVLEVLRKFSEAIDETVNFGTHVFKWCDESNTRGDETAPLFLSLRHILGLSDAVAINIRASAADPCKLLLRGSLESYLGIAYILEANTDQRGMAFMFWYVNQKLKLYKKLDFTTDQGKEFRKTLSTDKLFESMKLDYPKDKLDDAIDNLNSLLKKPGYVEAAAEYQRLRKSGKKNPHWYSFYNGPENVEKLATHLHSPLIYHILYRQWSEATHGTDIIQGVIHEGPSGTTEIVQLRLPKDAQILTFFAITIFIELYQRLIKHFVPSRLVDFKKWYTHELLPRYQPLSKEQIIQINY